MQNEQELSRVIDLYSDMVRRLCVLYLKNYSDTEDIFQTVFLKFFVRSKGFESLQHEKAWFIRVTINACKDLLKSFFRKKTVSMEEISMIIGKNDVESNFIIQAVSSLPDKYKEVVYLYYYEGYSAVEIGEILHKNVNTVYTLLSRAKQMLKNQLGDEFIE